MPVGYQHAVAGVWGREEKLELRAPATWARPRRSTSSSMSLRPTVKCSSIPNCQQVLWPAVLWPDLRGSTLCAACAEQLQTA